MARHVKNHNPPHLREVLRDLHPRLLAAGEPVQEEEGHGVVGRWVGSLVVAEAEVFHL